MVAFLIASYDYRPFLTKWLFGYHSRSMGKGFRERYAMSPHRINEKADQMSSLSQQPISESGHKAGRAHLQYISPPLPSLCPAFAKTSLVSCILNNLAVGPSLGALLHARMVRLVGGYRSLLAFRRPD